MPMGADVLEGPESSAALAAPLEPTAGTAATEAGNWQSTHTRTRKALAKQERIPKAGCRSSSEAARHQQRAAGPGAQPALALACLAHVTPGNRHLPHKRHLAHSRAYTHI